MKKFLIIFMAMLLLASCRPKMYFLNGPTPLCLIDSKDGDGYQLYNPRTKKVLNDYVYDTVYVGYRQLVGYSVSGEKDFYDHNGDFLFVTTSDFYIFETPSKTFYLEKFDRGYKWRTANGSLQLYVFPHELETLLEKSKIMDGFPICRSISDNYYPSNR